MTLKQLARKSIWAPGSVEAIDDRLKFQLRVGLPVYDGLLISFGVFAGISGTPALKDTFGEAYANSWGFILGISAIIALIGIAFPNYLWRVEFFAKSIIIGLLVMYAAAVFVVGFFVSGDLGRAGVGFGVLAMAVPAVIRSADIIRDKELHGWN